MDQFTRRIIGFGVHAGDVDGAALCRMFNGAIAGMGAPKYLSSDNDPLFTYAQWCANLRILEVDEVKSVPFTPMSHPFVERLIASVRSECLGQQFFWNAIDLERKLAAYRDYFNEYRVHSSLNGDTPTGSATTANKTKHADLRDFRWEEHCRGLVELPMVA